MFKKLIQSKALRSRTAWFITAILVLPFLLFFHFNSTSQGGPGGAAGTLYGKRIPWDQFDEQRRWVRLQWSLQFGQIPATLEPMVDGYTWDRLLLVEAAKRAGIRVSDRELAAFIQGMPQFQDQGRFVPERYYRFLQALGTSPGMFERFIQHDLMVERLANRIQDRVQVTDADVAQAYQDSEERRRIALLRWEAASFEPAAATLSDAEVDAHYRAREDLVTQPSVSTFETIGLTQEQASNDVAIPEEQVRRYYDEHQDEFTAESAPEAPSADATHAAQAGPSAAPPARPVDAEAGGDAAQAGAAKPLDTVRADIQDRLMRAAVKRTLTALAVDLEAARNEHQPFEAIAESMQLPIQQHGPYQDGNLFVVSGPDPTVLQAAFALTSPGALSPVVENDRGTHLVRLITRQPERVPPLEDVREVIVRDLLHARGRDAARAAAEGARAALTPRLAAGAAFEEAARDQQLSPSSPPPFTRTQPIEGLGQAPALTQAVFASAAPHLTPVVEAGDGFAVAYVREVLPPDPAGLTDARRAELKTQALESRRQAELTTWMDELKAAATPKSFVEEASGRP